MHPYVSSRVNEEHIAEMHRAADHRRLVTAAVAAGRGRPAALAPAALRKRAGWTLVHLGLRLVSGSADG